MGLGGKKEAGTYFGEGEIKGLIGEDGAQIFKYGGSQCSCGVEVVR